MNTHVQNDDSRISLLGLVIWLIAAFFFLYEFFLRAFLGTIANQVMSDLHLNLQAFAVMGSAYYIAYGVMQMPVGILADKFGVKYIMAFAMFICVISVLLFAYSTGFISAFFSRILMGAGSSFAFLSLLVVVTRWFPRKYFAFFTGLSQFIGTMGPLLAGGPLIWFLSKSNNSWRLALIRIGMVGIILTVLILLFVKNKAKRKNQKNKELMVYLHQSEKISTQLLRLMKNKQAWFIAAYSATTYISIELLGALWGTYYLETVGLSQATAANIISLIWFGYAVGCPTLGALSDFTKRRRPVLILCALAGFFATASISYFSFYSAWMYGVLFFCLGLAASGQNIGFAIISEHVDAKIRATALGLNNGLIIVFGTVLPPLMSTCISLSNPGKQLEAHNFTLGFSIMPILYLVSLTLVGFFIKETYGRPQKELTILKITK